MTDERSIMAVEIADAPAAVRRLLDGSKNAITNTAVLLRERDPAVIVTAARGSSDGAALLFKYACEIATGVPVASLGPSIASVYAAPLKLERAAALAISQSGRSPDLLALLERARAGGAVTAAIVNDHESPLAQCVDAVIPLRAGPERSVAATKSFIASAAAALALLAAWSGDTTLARAVEALPDTLVRARGCDWSAAVPNFARARSLFVLGRGLNLAVAHEAALKFKEVALLHAEAYSGAEVLHGPLAIIGESFPVLVLLPDDAARANLRETLKRLVEVGATVFVVSTDHRDELERLGVISLPVVSTGHPFTDPLAAAIAFYNFVERVARDRGLDPDHPPHLQKVTRTR